MIDISTKGKGAIPRGPDPRDILFKDIIAGAGQVDWNIPYDVRNVIGDLSVNNQDGSSSCTGQAASKLAEIAEAFEVAKQTRLSARDIYSRIFVPSGGAYGYRSLSVITQRGVATEATVSSYDNGLPPSEEFMRVKNDSVEATKEALIRKATGYAHVSQNIDEMALAIKNQNGIVFGVIGTNNGWTNGDIPKPPQSGEEVWYHFIVGTGYRMIGGKKFITILNSWGKEWGYDGVGFISEDYIVGGWTFNAMTLVDMPNPPQKIYMKRVIKLNDSNDQYLVESGRKMKIPDASTLEYLRDELKIITGTPEIVELAEFNALVTSKPLPSVNSDQFARDAYAFFKDRLPLLKDVVEAE